MGKMKSTIGCLLLVIMIAGCSAEEDPNQVSIDKSAEEMVGENYEVIMKELNNQGFSSIETIVLDDLIIGWLTKDGEIETIEINGDSDFASNDTFAKDSKIVITYHTFPEDEAESTEVAENEEGEKEEAEVEESQEATEKEEESSSEMKEQNEVITIENNEEFAALLKLNDPYDVSVNDFVEKYKGRTIKFDSNIADIMQHDGASTRFDILVYQGDYSETSVFGPSFKFEDVNMMDLNLTGDNVPDTLSTGQNIRVEAVVSEYDENSGLLFLEPIETEFR